MKRMKTLFGALAVGLMLLWSGPVSATHAVGADVTWTCNPSNPCLITFTFTFYRDCGGINYGNPPNLSFASLGGATPVATGAWVGGLIGEITPVCVTQTSNCNGGTFPGIQEFQHTRTYDFCAGGVPASSYTASWTIGDRNNGITSLAFNGQNMGTVSVIPINPSTCNNSPVFNSIPVLYICDGQTNVFSQGASDPDGNTLQYSMIGCRETAATPVTYAAGFSAAAPLGPGWGVAINATTGNLTFTPTPGGPLTAVVCVRVDELDGTGAVIGSVVRDIQVRVLNCSNSLPFLSGPFNYSGCVGDQFCLNVTSGDLDAGDNLTVSVISNNTGAPINISGGQFPTANMCFTPTAPGIYTIVLEVRDDACPLNGVQQFTYTIEIESCDPCDVITINPSFTHVEGLLQTTVTNTSTVTPMGLGPIFTHIRWGDMTSTSYSGNYTSPVSHTYATPGVYTVCVVIEAFVGNVCCHDSVCVDITITDDPCDFHVADWYAVALLSPRCTYRFYDNSSPYSSSVYWDFGDGSPLAFGSPVQHTFPTGTWTITMTSVYHPPGHPDICCYDTHSETYRIDCRRIIDDPHDEFPHDVRRLSSLVAFNGQDASLNVFPSEEIILKAPAQLSIYDLSGKRLHSEMLDTRRSYKVDLSGYSNGVYMVRISGNDNVETTKIVKF